MQYITFLFVCFLKDVLKKRTENEKMFSEEKLSLYCIYQSVLINMKIVYFHWNLSVYLNEK